MKISNSDRLHAIARNPYFIKFRDKHGTFAKDGDFKECAKIIDDFDLTQDEFWYVFKTSSTLSKKKVRKSALRPTIIPVSVSEKRLTSKLLNFEPHNLSMQQLLEATRIGQNILDTRYILVKIDPLADELDIIKQLKKLLKSKRVKTRSRKRETTVDPWNAYDIHDKKNMNLSQISKKLFKIKKNPTYDNKAKSRYQQVERAYKKAQKMIEHVTPPNLK